MNKVLYQLCRHCVGIMDGWHPYSSTDIARCLGISKGKAYYQLKKLKEQGLVKSCKEGGQTEYGDVFCLRGFTVTDKAKETEEYKMALQEEAEICKKCFDIDIL